jgi:dGTPase
MAYLVQNQLKQAKSLRYQLARPLQLFASNWQHSRGRLIHEASSPTRSDYQRDRDRIIHSSAFRRLKHKTQVFVEHEGDHHRTRLTHTLEVAQIARSISRALGLDEDLAEALALAHDLGHTPFGHTGEDALHEVMQSYGGFDHNAQTLRIVTSLEKRYAAYDGLNLTWETLEGLAKHNGAVLDKAGAPIGRYAKNGLPMAIATYNKRHDLQLATFASAEAQVAAIADDIAYNAHDIDDGLRAGLFTLDDARDVPHLAALLDDIKVLWPELEVSRIVHELQRRVITRFVEDVIATSENKIFELNPQCADDIRNAGHSVVTFSSAMAAADRAIKGFLFPSMYRHPDILRIRTGATQIVQNLFVRLLAMPDLLPLEWRVNECGDIARQVADYIAGMTDRYAIQTHRRLFDVTPELR